MAASRSNIDPSHEMRKDAIEHVVYEYANLISAYRHSMGGKAPWRTHADDAFLLGYRKLGDFLLNQYPRHKDDVLALDYLPRNSAKAWDLPTWQKEWREHMNKQLTHVAYARVLAPREWDHLKWNLQLHQEFLSAWSTFRDAVMDQDFRKEFEAQIRHCRAKPGFTDIPLQ